MTDYRKDNYKTGFEIWRENTKLQIERKSIENIGPHLESTPVIKKMSYKKKPATDAAKTSDVKTPATDSSEFNLYSDTRSPDSSPSKCY